MTQGQEKFLHFIMDRVSNENQEKAKTLLNESFDMQSHGLFNSGYMHNFIPRMLVLLKPEHVNEVQEVMANYKA